MRRFDSVLWSWMTIAALLAAAVSPAVLAPGRGVAGWDGICSGASAAAADASGGAPSLPGNQHPFGHCQICALHGAPPGPPQAGPVFALLALAFALPRMALAAPPASHGWRAAQPRAPPPRD
jgi:hypothetical protein